jgi:hypothetical protein
LEIIKKKQNILNTKQNSEYDRKKRSMKLNYDEKKKNKM